MVRVRIGGEERTLSWEEWERQVRTGRIPEECDVLFEPVTGDRWTQASDLEMYTSLRRGATRAFQGAGAIPIVTALLVGINIRIWWTQLWLIPARQTLVDKCLAGHATVMEAGEGWRMVATGFCHTDLMHIGANLLWMAFAGWGVERALGRVNVMTIYLGSVLVGSLLSILFAPESSALGASGGVFGLVAAVIVLGFARPDVLPEDRRGIYGFAMFPYLVLMFLGGLTDDSIANWAHFGGMITGGLLATVLDPVALQRRPRWNLRWQGLVASAILLMLTVPLVAGPRLHLLIDEQAARSVMSRVKVRPADKAARYRSLSYSVPAGWRPGINSAGDPAFGSPISGTTRSWSVSEGTEDRPVDSEALLARWRSRIERGHTDVVFTDARPETRGDLAGLAATARLTRDDETHALSWWGTTRGVHTLQVVWQNEDDDAARMRPLLRRLKSRVVWRDPPDLRNAVWEHGSHPSRKARAALARALSGIGDSGRSVELWLALIAENPEKSDYWDGLLRTLEWYPSHPDADRLWERTLSEHPSPRTVTRIAQGLDAAGRTDVANGLVDIAWGRWPGDRLLKRARRGRNQSTTLDPETLMPWERVYDPVDGQPRAHVQSNEALTLQSGTHRGQELAAETLRIEAAAVAWIGDHARDEPPLALLYIRFAEVPTDPSEALELLADEIDRTADDAPGWMQESLLRAIRANPTLADRLRDLAEDT